MRKLCTIFLSLFILNHTAVMGSNTGSFSFSFNEKEEHTQYNGYEKSPYFRTAGRRAEGNKFIWCGVSCLLLVGVLLIDRMGLLSYTHKSLVPYIPTNDFLQKIENGNVSEVMDNLHKVCPDLEKKSIFSATSACKSLANSIISYAAEKDLGEYVGPMLSLHNYVKPYKNANTVWYAFASFVGYDKVVNLANAITLSKKQYGEKSKFIEELVIYLSMNMLCDDSTRECTIKKDDNSLNYETIYYHYSLYDQIRKALPDPTNDFLQKIENGNVSEVIDNLHKVCPGLESFFSGKPAACNSLANSIISYTAEKDLGEYVRPMLHLSNYVKLWNSLGSYISGNDRVVNLANAITLSKKQYGEKSKFIEEIVIYLNMNMPRDHSGTRCSKRKNGSRKCHKTRYRYYLYKEIKEALPLGINLRR